MLKYSVIIPAYQSEKTICNTVRSVLNAGLQDMEVIIIDDGSTDGTATICTELCTFFPNVRYFSQSNQGVSAARNHGIEKARGEFILFVDDDDTLAPFDPMCLDTNLTDEVDVLIFGMEFQYWQKKICRRKEIYACDRILEFSIREIGSYFSELFYRNYFSSSCNRIIRRSMLQKYDIRFDVRLINYEDLDFSIRIAAFSRKTVAIPNVHYYYYQTYNQDRTVGRVRRIPNIIAAVDPIADSMFMLNQRLREVSGQDCDSLLRITLQLYVDMFMCKMKTATLSQVRQQCGYFRECEKLRHCAKYFSELSDQAQTICKWIKEDKTSNIWLYFRYRNLRNVIVSNAKMLLGRY